ncbi:ABC transporter ATP-binding protein [Oryzobacter telluris]|uniref:ABC transporter ATP-binding protein n=1 Tax=Oryzobacter telluris TaxID=3149179 RepID=UPI00370DB027
MAAPAIELRALGHRYDGQPVLRDIDLTIEAGEVFGFLGHNGAGKTTTVNILTTLIRPTSGSAQVCGHDVVTARHEVTACIGYLPAEVRMYGHLTASENLEFLATLSGVANPRRAARDTLGYLDCADLADRRVGTFSTGMRQRVGIAQAIVHRPRVLFLDEPTAGLDPFGVRQLRETVLRLNADLGMTVFMNTHLLSEVAKVCTTIGVLNQGELVYKDSIEETTRRFPDEASLEDIYVRMGGAPA